MSALERAPWRAERPGPFRLISAGAVLALVLVLAGVAFEIALSSEPAAFPVLGIALTLLALWRLWDILKIMGLVPIAVVDLVDGHAQLRTPVLGTTFTRVPQPLSAPLHLDVRSRRGIFGGTHTYRLNSEGPGVALVSSVPVSADSLAAFGAAVERAGGSLTTVEVEVDRFGRPKGEGGAA